MPQRSILDDIADLKRKVADLERTTRIPQFSDASDIDEGYDGAVILNRRQTAITPTDPAIVALLIAQYGWELPALAGFWSSSEFVAVTSGVFVAPFTMQFHEAIADGFQAEISWVTDPATTGELRIHNEVIGGSSTNTVTLAAGSSGVQRFDWLHSQTIGTGPFRPQVQVRRTGGAGNVNVFIPHYGHQIGGRWISATSGGT